MKTADKEIAKYDTLQKIVDQLEWCNYECEAGYLNNNVAFLSLKQKAEHDAKIKALIDEEVIRLKQKLEDTPKRERELRWLLGGKIEALQQLKEKLCKTTYLTHRVGLLWL